METHYEKEGGGYLALHASLVPYAVKPIKVESPSDYDTASTGSLQNESGGGWCISVPDFNISIDDLQDDVDAIMDPMLWPGAEMLCNNVTLDEEVNGGGNYNNGYAIVEWNPPHAPEDSNTGLGQNQKLNHLNMGPTCALLCGGYGPNSGLLDMIVNPLSPYAGSNVEPTINHEEAFNMKVKDNLIVNDTCMLPCLKRGREATIKGSEETKTVKQKPLDLNLLVSKLAEVVERVEKAIISLPTSSKTKKIKSTITMTATKIRDFTKLLDDRSTIHGLALEDEKAVVVLSSDSSDGSDSRGTKRKSREAKDWERAMAVSSRLRNKTRTKKQAAAEIIKKAQRKKLKKLPVRKIKATGNKINTNLTLAPPSPGNVAA